MMSCAAPLDWETLVAYWADDLTADEAERLEEHLMGCALCSEASQRVAELSQALRELLPPLLRPDQLDELRQRGLQVVENPMLPGERRRVVFPREADILLHRLGGLPPQVVHVQLRMRDERSGQLMLELPEAVFDAVRGELLLCCRKHFAHLPPDNLLELELRLADGTCRALQYTILHEFA